LRHLAGRFFTALSPAGPPVADAAWVHGKLLPGERALWARMSGSDQRHAVGVARETIRLLGPEEPGRAVVAAALLHDVGKVDARFGTFSRAWITAGAMVFGRTRVVRWSEDAPGDPAAHDTGGPKSVGMAAQRVGRRARVALYLRHDQIGAAQLERAGSDGLTVTWAREHHLDPAAWTIDRTVAAALKEADGD